MLRDASLLGNLFEAQLLAFHADESLLGRRQSPNCLLQGLLLFLLQDRGISSEIIVFGKAFGHLSLSRSFCLLQTLTHRFFVALISRASMLSPLLQPRSSIRTQTSCTTSSASSRLRKKLMATRIILSRVWRSKCSNSVCVICLYNARHREMSSKEVKNFSVGLPQRLVVFVETAEDVKLRFVGSVDGLLCFVALHSAA